MVLRDRIEIICLSKAANGADKAPRSCSCPPRHDTTRRGPAPRAARRASRAWRHRGGPPEGSPQSRPQRSKGERMMHPIEKYYISRFCVRYIARCEYFWLSRCSPVACRVEVVSFAGKGKGDGSPLAIQSSPTGLPANKLVQTLVNKNIIV